jgi:hypothetical protein
MNDWFHQVNIIIDGAIATNVTCISDSYAQITYYDNMRT